MSVQQPKQNYTVTNFYTLLYTATLYLDVLSMALMSVLILGTSEISRPTHYTKYKTSQSPTRKLLVFKTNIFSTCDSDFFI